MKNLTNDEINRILAEFDGRWLMKFGDDLGMSHRNKPYEYTQDLNATARVWEKLDTDLVSFSMTYKKRFTLIKVFKKRKYLFEVQDDNKDLKHCASYATALAILELKKEKDNEQN